MKHLAFYHLAKNIGLIFLELTELRKQYLLHTDSFINIVEKGNRINATDYFEKVLQPHEQNYGTKQIGFASSFRTEAYTNANTLESISAKVGFLNILISFTILFIIVISILYLILLIINFFREIRWSDIVCNNVSIVK